MNKRQMQKLYRNSLSYVSIVTGFPNREDRVNEELKTAYNIQTTSLMTGDEYYRYIEFCFWLIGEVFDLHFDTEAFKGGGVRFIYNWMTF